MTSDFERIAQALAATAAAYRAEKNAPGRPFVVYRHADYLRFRAAMLAGLDVVEVTAGSPPQRVRPLAGANRDARTDWMISLLDAWAVVGDILMFYQDRIVNEGYLQTAREAFSLDQLTRGIGARRGGAARAVSDPAKKVSPAEHPPQVKIVSRAPTVPSQLRPPVPTVPTPGAPTALPLPVPADRDQDYRIAIDPGAAAITDMSFQVTPQRATNGRALVRAGTAIRSHRVDGGPPILFETSVDLEARLEYNSLKPTLTERVVEPVLTRASIGLELAGTATGLKAGDNVLVLGRLERPNAEVTANDPSAWLFGQLTSVEPNRALGTTVITWAAPDGVKQDKLADGQLTALRVFGFQRTVAPFGADAKPLSDAPVATQVALSKSGGVSRLLAGGHEWQRLREGLPERALSATAVDDDGNPWVGGAFGVAIWGRGDGAWLARSTGLGMANVIRFAVGDDADLWLGTSTGQVFRATGSAKGWSAITGSFTLVSGPSKHWVPVKTSLPRAPITALQPFASVTKASDRRPELAASQDAEAPFSLPAAAVLIGSGLGVFGNLLDGRGWLPADPERYTPTSGAPSVTTSAPIVDLRVLPASVEDGYPPAGYAIAATTDQLFAFCWSPLEPPPVMLPLEPPPVVPPPVVPPPEPPPVGLSTQTGTPSPQPTTHSSKPHLPSGCPPYGKVDPPPGELRQVAFVRTDARSATLLVLTSEGAYLWQAAATAEASPDGTQTANAKANVDASASSTAGATPGGSGAFVALTSGLDDKPLQSITAVPRRAQATLGGLALGNDGAKVWVLAFDSGWRWRELTGFPGSDDSDAGGLLPIATTVAVGPNGDVLASAPLVLAEGWPGYEVVVSSKSGAATTSFIDVAGKSFDLAPGSLVVAVSGKEAKAFSLLDTEVTYRTGEAAFGQPGRVFRLFVQDLGAGTSAPLPPRSTDVLLRSVELAVAQRTLTDSAPVGGVELSLDGSIDGLDVSSRTDPARTGRLLAFTGQRPRVCVTMAGGLWQATARQGSGSGASFTAWREQGFAFENVTALANVAGELWVATDRGVSVRHADGRWHSRSAGLTSGEGQPQVLALTGVALQLVAATGAGLFRWSPIVKSWLLVAGVERPLAVAVAVAGQKATWWVGTAESGLWSSTDGESFAPVPAAQALVGAPVQALAVSQNELLIGTPSATYRLHADPTTASLLPLAPIGALALAANDRTVLVGTDAQGVWAIDELEGKPTHRQVGLPDQRVPVVAALGGRWLAGTASAGLFVSEDAKAWAALPVGVATHVQALASCDASGLVVGMGTPVALRSKGGAVMGSLSFSALTPCAPSLVPALNQALVTAGLRKTFADAKHELPEDAVISTLENGRRWLLTSQSDTGSPVYVLFETALGELRAIRPLSVPIACGAWPASEVEQVVDVEVLDGELSGQLSLGPGQWTLRPPLSGDPVVSEVRRIAHAGQDAQRGATGIRLEKALCHAYARTSLSVSANVVRASQGETVNGDILGNGNSSVPNQRFQLRRAPLTFLPAPPPEYRRSTLRVTVSGVTWQEVGDLTQAGGEDRAFSVAIDHEGRATLTFGDGVHGARLPTGTQNVVATYRVGLGAQGDVPAGTLDMMLSPPPGIRSVTNPIPATRGVDPSHEEAVRVTVPRSLATGNRVVSLADATALAGSYPGVRDAIASEIKHPRGPAWQLSVVFDASVSASEYAARCASMTRSLRKVQAQPAPFLGVAASAPCYFGIEARLWLRGQRAGADVAASACDALLLRWSLAAAKIGQDVQASAVEGVLQTIHGVAGSQVLGLRAPGSHSRDDARRLRATPAHYDASSGRTVAANLLVLDPGSGGASSRSVVPPGSYARGSITLHIIEEGAL